MTPLTEATEEDVRATKIRAIQNLIGDSIEQFNLDSMNDESLDSLLAELNKASIQESNKDALQKQLNEIVAVYKLQEKYGFKRDEAEIVLKDILNERKKK